MARRRRTRRSAKIVLDRYKVAGLMITLGGLFFFVLFMAQGSPIFMGLSFPTNQAFGIKGSIVFYAMLILLGAIVLIKPTIYNRRLFKFSLIILLIICGILNFELLEYGFKTGLTPAIQQLVHANGGRLGYAALMAADWALGGENQAIRIIFYAALVAMAVIIAIYYNIKLPTFQLELIRDAASNTKRIINKAKPAIEKNSKELTNIESETTYAVDNTYAHENQTAKILLKDKLKKTLAKKEDEATLQQLHIAFPKDKPTFEISYLDPSPLTNSEIDDEWLLEKANAIKNKLEEFDIPVDIDGVNVGPTVMQIKIQPQAGVKISKIENLKKDISLALKTKSLRILAPIPGTDTVGIEIPNPKPQLVVLRELMSSSSFAKAMSQGFTNLPIGKAIDGTYYIKALDAMPHLLIAGATGSGKSVSVNDYIISLIYQNSPSELKFIMVDPKQVELGIYEGIPYLLAPIITQPDKAVKVLRWAVQFMEERYKLLKDNKVRNVAEYNEKVDDKDKMYRLIIIIDELADLMMSGNKKDTETYITRIAQKARAVGIHLILATQRPSVNVITGLIKANVPTRIAHGVVSQIDSRTILDQKGAEDLVGKGDLLYTDPKNNHPVRLQAPFVSTGETESVVRAIKSKYMQGISESEIYHPEIMRILEAKGELGGGGEVSSDDEDLVDQAIEIISSSRKASATMLQRKLGIGFPRAARIIDILEERGIIGPQEGAKPREILI